VKGGKAAIFADIPQVSKAVDPTVQVLVLTDIVIEATVTGLLLALAVQERPAHSPVCHDRFRFHAVLRSPVAMMLASTFRCVICDA